VERAETEIGHEVMESKVSDTCSSVILGAEIDCNRDSQMALWCSFVRLWCSSLVDAAAAWLELARSFSLGSGCFGAMAD
jgi:hypothetical protein